MKRLRCTRTIGSCHSAICIKRGYSLLLLAGASSGQSDDTFGTKLFIMAGGLQLILYYKLRVVVKGSGGTK
eukprot:scaffold75250_cov22-Prasinocladus_malaysianus.AAC.1